MCLIFPYSSVLIKGYELFYDTVYSYNQHYHVDLMMNKKDQVTNNLGYNYLADTKKQGKSKFLNKFLNKGTPYY